MAGLLVAFCPLFLSQPAEAQFGQMLYAGPRGTTAIAPPPGPGPLDPLSVAAYWGYWPNPVLARQPTGHQIIATSANGYVYRPVYADDATAASIALPNSQETVPAPSRLRTALNEASPRRLFNAALTLFQSGDYEAAIDRLNRVLDAQPDDGDALLLLVQCYFGLVNYEAAAEALAAALDAAPETDWEKYAGNYKRYYGSPLRFAVHLRALERFVEQHPDRFEGHLLIGYQYGSLGQLDRALAELKLAGPGVEVDALIKHFTAAKIVDDPAPGEDLNGPRPKARQRRGRAF
ncbi:MAG TPA: tetratricopeptide repeat protein [Pirellulales bacterium]|nr:tetratricopeptide repeat protein [Pirellulales bacterium]